MLEEGDVIELTARRGEWILRDAYKRAVKAIVGSDKKTMLLAASNNFANPWRPKGTDTGKLYMVPDDRLHTGEYLTRMRLNFNNSTMAMGGKIYQDGTHIYSDFYSINKDCRLILDGGEKVQVTEAKWVNTTFVAKGLVLGS